MAILAPLQSAAILLIGRRPGSFFGSSETFEMEIAELVNEVAEDVSKYQDWQALVRVAELAGDGAAETFDLPTDYSRQLQSAEIQGTAAWAWGYHRFTDLNAFLFAQNQNFTGFPGGWTIYGDKVRFAPAPTGSSMYPYVTKNWAKSSTGEPKSAFTADTDEFLLPERLLKLGLIWRWRENKKLDASGDQEAFIKALDEYAAKDKGSRTYRSSARRSFRGTHVAWPWPLGA